MPKPSNKTEKGGGVKKIVGGVTSKPSVRKTARPSKMMKGVGPALR